jgi:hypothetical protein
MYHANLNHYSHEINPRHPDVILVANNVTRKVQLMNTAIRKMAQEHHNGASKHAQCRQEEMSSYRFRCSNRGTTINK